MKFKKSKKLIFLILCFFIFSGFCYSQNREIDPNIYYRYPFSTGVGYQNLFVISGDSDPLRVYDIAAELRMPFQRFPYISPLIKTGITIFDNRNTDEPDKWDNNSVFLTAGADFSWRFNRIFEAGAEVHGGYSHSLYADYDPSRGTLSNSNIVCGGGFELTLSPFYNFAFQLKPSVRYYKSIGNLAKYDGLYLAAGAAFQLRLGDDPDKGGTIIRSIRFDKPDFGPVFAAMQSYYSVNPAGSVAITNTAELPVYDLEVSFFQQGYMDGPTSSGVISELAPGENVLVKFPAAYNRSVFETEGITPLTGEIIASYIYNGKPAEQRKSVTYDLHDKTALVWDDDRKMGAFITPADSAVRDLASRIRVLNSNEIVPSFSKELQFAMQAYGALAGMGIIYQPDPSNSFTKVQGDTRIVDSISLPRDTLKRITGDCDDLTALYCTILESVNIPTAFVTTPGHIFAGFNTGVPAKDFRDLHPDRDMTIVADGELWALVEITMIGKQDFMTAWDTGMREFHMYDSQPEKRGFYITREAQEVYRPVGLRQEEGNFELDDRSGTIQAYKSSMDTLSGIILAELKGAAEESGAGRLYNRYGIAAARLNRFDEAEKAFGKAVELSGNSLSARINLGSMYFLMERYGSAADIFKSINDELSESDKRNTARVKVLINLSRAQHEIGESAAAKVSYETALSIDPQIVNEYSYLARISAGESRAGEINETETIFFVEENDE